MSMTRQNYEAIARTLGQAVAVEAIEDDAQRAALCTGAAYRVALAVADCLADSSPRYNRARFLAAVREHADRTRCELGGLPAIEAGYALRAAGVA
jgi:hypothetical protein